MNTFRSFLQVLAIAFLMTAASAFSQDVDIPDVGDGLFDGEVTPPPTTGNAGDVTPTDLGTDPGIPAPNEPVDGLTTEVMMAVQAKVMTMVEAGLTRLTDEPALAKSWGVGWPIPQVKEEVKSVEARIVAKLSEEAKAKYPATLRNDYTAEAQKKYSEYRAGDIVDIQMRDGRQVKGAFRGRNGTMVKIDAKDYSMNDIATEDRARFSRDLADQLISAYVQKKLDVLAAKRVEYLKDNRERVAYELYREAGYVLVYGEWIPRSELFRRKLAAHRRTLIQRLMPLAEAKVYYDYGFEKFQNKWIPIREAEKLRREDLFDAGPINAELDGLNADAMAQTLPQPEEPAP